MNWNQYLSNSFGLFNIVGIIIGMTEERILVSTSDSYRDIMTSALSLLSAAVAATGVISISVSVLVLATTPPSRLSSSVELENF